jgi:hypothetical protein
VDLESVKQGYSEKAQRLLAVLAEEGPTLELPLSDASLAAAAGGGGGGKMKPKL